MKAYVSAFLAALCLSAPVAATKDAPPLRDQQQAQATPVAARFEARLSDRTGGRSRPTTWLFYREANRVETLRPEAGLAETWDRDERGHITLRRVFRSDRRIVEYMPSELKALNLEPFWPALSAVIDPRGLDVLKLERTAKLAHGMAKVYRGLWDGQAVEVWWLEEHALPARVKWQGADGHFTLTLKTLEPSPPATWPRPTQAELSDYQRIDVADFGDMAYDPFVRKVERLNAPIGILGSAAVHRHAH